MISSHRKAPCAPSTLALACMLLTTAWLPSGVARAQPGPDVRLSRYTTSSATPDAAQLDPLEAVVQVRLPRASVATVGDAVRYLLLRTGYRLAAPEAANTSASEILALPLPEVHRHLGPYSVRTAMTVLLGQPFALTVDPAQRLVSYRTTSPVAPGTEAPLADAPGSARAASVRTGSTR
jgi:conjugative transfer region protein (TIGR03748 family)